ncbi:hypothetical protein ACH5RR_023306 [Cinchona calisaya]|uniref:Uncharacterized protein n=1 Tax=Cinchona calisaya TaxID=153742 RepID=A0ABD2ZAA6_9GENT
MVLADAAVPLHNQGEILRPFADFPEDILADRFDSFTEDIQVHDMYAKETETLKQEIRSMLVANESAILEKLNLIDVVEWLGISYHFEGEIAEQLEEIFDVYANRESYPESYDLFTAALHFRLFRQHGFSISERTHKQRHKGFAKPEAAQVRTHKGIILEEALAFATTNLKHEALHTSHNLAKQVKYTLKQALPKCIQLAIISLSMRKTNLGINYFEAIDDTYDSYGSLDELKTFTEAIERWDAIEVDRLPIYMRTSYMSLLNVSDGVDKELTGQQRSYAADK